MGTCQNYGLPKTPVKTIPSCSGMMAKLIKRHKMNSLLKRIEHIQAKHPELRLMQILENVTPRDAQGQPLPMYYMEDDELARRLDEFYGISSEVQLDLPDILKVIALAAKRVFLREFPDCTYSDFTVSSCDSVVARGDFGGQEEAIRIPVEDLGIDTSRLIEMLKSQRR